MTDSTRVSRADNAGSVDQTGESTPSPAVLEPVDAVSAQVQQVGNHSCAGTEEPVARVESRRVDAQTDPAMQAVGALLDSLWAATAELARAFEVRFTTEYMYRTHKYRDCAEARDSHETPVMKIAVLQDAIQDARAFFESAERIK